MSELEQLRTKLNNELNEQLSNLTSNKILELSRRLDEIVLKAYANEERK